jgi:heme A synthase
VTALALLSGAVVTTFRVGMADPIWPTYPWHLLLISWEEPSPGFLVEHTHRLMDYLAGFCITVLAVGLWAGERRRWLARLGLAALAAVVLQGLLGGFRVKLNEWAGTDLAFVHGCFAQLVFALLAGLAVFTSPTWAAGRPASDPAGQARRRERLAWLTAGLVYGQLVFGGLVRHASSKLGQRGHLLLAFAVVAAVVWLLKMTLDSPETGRRDRRTVTLLAGLVGLQLALGVEAWMGKFATGVLPELQQITIRQGVVRTAHFLVGSLVFATAVVTALRAHGPAVPAVRAAPPPAGRLEGAA